jgi:hypothetical protein
MPFDSNSAKEAGQKSKRGVSERTQLLNELFKSDKAKAIWEKLEADALTGNMDAIKTYLAYIFGKPKETVDFNIPEGIRLILKKHDSGH